MIFEVGIANASHCHVNLRPALELFNAGKVVEAYQLAFSEIRKPNESSELNEADWTLLSTLANACGYVTKSRAIHKLGFERNPDSILLALLHAWELSAYGRYFECRDLLDQLVDRANEWKGLALALQAYNFSTMRWDQTAAKHHEIAIKFAGQNPLVWYVLSRAAARRTDWQRAVSEGRKVVELCPSWSRARAALADSLLAIGECAAAREILRAEAAPSIRLDFLRAMCCQATNKPKGAIAKLAELVQTWPRETRFAKYAVRQLTLLMMQQGMFEAAETIIQEFELEEFQVDKSRTCENAKQKYISMPLVSQTRNHCVPTLAAMVAGSQGVIATPRQYADGMQTRHGTPMWRMVDFMKSQGFRAVCVRPEVEIAKALLEQNVPLIGEMTNVFSGHVDCVCGYDDRLELFYLRDPMHWHGSSIKFDELESRYYGSASLWALIPGDRIDEVHIEPDWEHVEGQALIDLSRACTQGKRLDAETAYSKIADDSPLAFTRDGMARSVVLTAAQDLKRLQHVVNEIGKDDEGVEYYQIRALLQLIDHDNADFVLDFAKQHVDKLSRTFIKYVEAQCLYAKSLWQESLEVFTEVCQLWPSLDSVWSQLAQVQQQLGMADEAKKSLQIAIEVAPDQGRHQTTHLFDRESDIPFDARLATAKSLIEQFPDSPSTRTALAQVMINSENGLEYETSLLDTIKYFPRSDWAYGRLANWYLSMGREDKAHSILNEARELMGNDEMPYWNFELDNEKYHEPEVTIFEQEESAEPDTKTPETESSDTSAKYLELWGEASKEFNLPHAEFEELLAVKQLSQLDSDRRLLWWQSVRVLSLRVANLLNDQTVLFNRKNAHRASALKRLLPTSVPGVAECYVLEFMEDFQYQNRPHDCLQVLLEWVDQLATNQADYARLCFQRAFLLEQLGRFNESEDQLKRIVEIHPAHYASFYRLGQISLSREDVLQARSYFNQCLAVSPGNNGSLESLLEIAEYLEEDILDLRVRLWQLQPYSHSCIYNVAAEFVKQRGAEAGHKFLDDHDSYFDASRFPVMKARLFITTEQHDEALAHVNTMPDEGPDYSADWIRVDCALAKDDYAAVVDQVSKMLDHWPDEPDLVDQMARTLRERDLVAAKSYSKKKLLEGNLVPLLAYIVLENETLPDEVAMDLLNQAKLEHRDALADVLINMLARSANLEHNVKFMRFCRERLPHVRRIRRMLAYDLLRLNHVDDAIEVARELVKEQPDNPEYLECIGYCLQENEPLNSISFFEQAYDLTGKIETLSELARSYQILGDEEKGKELHWKTLELDPHNSVAMTNLHWEYNESSIALMDLMMNTFENNVSDFNAEYFLVTVVKLATKHKRPLPDVWLKHALNRAMYVQKNGGFMDEGQKLGAYIEIWLDQWKQAEDPGYGPQSNGREEIWIPEKPVDYEYPSIAGENGEEAMGIALSIAGPLPGHYSEKRDFNSIEQFVQTGEACMSRNMWQDAEQNFQKAIDNFDDTVARTERQIVVRRWLDSKKQGSLLDRISQHIPAGGTNLAFWSGMFSIIVAALVLYAAKSLFGYSVEFLIAYFVAPCLIVLPSTYYFVRFWESKKHLDEIEHKQMIDRAVHDNEIQSAESLVQFESEIAASDGEESLYSEQVAVSETNVQA